MQSNVYEITSIWDTFQIDYSRMSIWFPAKWTHDGLVTSVNIVSDREWFVYRRHQADTSTSIESDHYKGIEHDFTRNVHELHP